MGVLLQLHRSCRATRVSILNRFTHSVGVMRAYFCVTSRSGAIAQLVERCNRTAEVRSSNLLSSTKDLVNNYWQLQWQRKKAHESLSRLNAQRLLTKASQHLDIRQRKIVRTHRSGSNFASIIRSFVAIRFIAKYGSAGTIGTIHYLC